LADLLNTFQRVVVINLSRRIDRKESVTKELANWPFKQPIFQVGVDGEMVTAPDGFREGNNVWGCLQSHRHALEDALNNDCDSLLVLEDDVVLCPDFNAMAEQFISEMPEDWEICFLGGHHMVSPMDLSENVVRCVQMDRCHAYALKGRGLRELYRYWHQWHPGHCDHAISKWVADYKAYAPKSWLIGQKGGYSDILRDNDEQLLKGEEWWNPGTPIPLDRVARSINDLPCKFRGEFAGVRDVYTPMWKCSEESNKLGLTTFWQYKLDQPEFNCSSCDKRPRTPEEIRFDEIKIAWKNRKEVKTSEKPILTAALPTRGRGEQCKKSIQSFYETTRGHDRECVVVSHPDSAVPILREMELRQDLYPGLRVFVEDTDAISAWNIAFKHSRGFFISISDDDLEYAFGWFEALLKKWEGYGGPEVALLGLWDPDARVQRGELFTRSVLTRPFCMTVMGGVLCVPYVKRWWNDNSTTLLARKANCAYPCFEAVIKHHQAALGLSVWDETAEIGKQRGINDQRLFEEWKARGAKIEWKSIFDEANQTQLTGAER
jgi:hypothetical protein